VLVLEDRELADASNALAEDTSLRARIVRTQSGDREVFAIEGRVASARAALTEHVPSFIGVEAEARDLRELLVSDLARRHATRLDRRAKIADLVSCERSVNLTVSSILSLLRSVTRIAASKEGLEKLSVQVPDIEVEIARNVAEAGSAQDESERAVAALESRIAALDGEHLSRDAQLAQQASDAEGRRSSAVARAADELTKSLEALEKVRSVDAELKARMTQQSREYGEAARNRAEDELIEAKRQRENLKRQHADGRDLLNRELEAKKRQTAIETSKRDRQHWTLKRQLKLLLHAEGLCQKDVETLQGLERGLRLSEAENPD